MLNHRFLRLSLLACALGVLAACSSGPVKPQPAELGPAPSIMGTRLLWSAQIGAGPVGVSMRANGDRILAAGAGNSLVALDTETGKEMWRAALSAPIKAGIGFDGDVAAVVTQENDLVALRSGQVLWRMRLATSVYTEPLVAGRRVFVQGADRSIAAYDAETGRRLWMQSRTGEPLVLSRPGVLLAVGDTLVTGVAGRLSGLNPLNGSTRWETPIATARGTNEVERLVDLVGPASRVGNSVCVRAYASAVGCVDASRGQLVWTKPATGSSGLGGDDRLLFGTESDGRVLAWHRNSGDVSWSLDRLKHRELSAPTALGRVFAVGDSTGLVFLLSREDGSEMARLTTDGSPLTGVPLLAGPSLVVQTRNGGVFAWRPQ